MLVALDRREHYEAHSPRLASFAHGMARSARADLGAHASVTNTRGASMGQIGFRAFVATFNSKLAGDRKPHR